MLKQNTIENLVEIAHQHVQERQDRFGHNLAFFPYSYFLAHQNETLEEYIALATSFSDEDRSSFDTLRALSRRSGIGWAAALYLVKTIQLLGVPGFRTFVGVHHIQILRAGNNYMISDGEHKGNVQAESTQEMNKDLECIVRGLVSVGISPQAVFDNLFV